MKNIPPLVHAIIVALCVSALALFLVDIGFILIMQNQVNFAYAVPSSLVLGVIVFVLLIKSGLYERISNDSEPLNTGATQLYDIKMGKHHTTIINVLTTWKKQLLVLSRKNNLKYNDFALKIEGDGYFRYALTHCPTLNNEHATFLIRIGLYQEKIGRLEKLKKIHQTDQELKKEIKESRLWFNESIKSYIELIDNSLRSLEYEKNLCPGCPMNMVNRETLSQQLISKPACNNPVIHMEAKVYYDCAKLEITNSGFEADFTATARVVDGVPKPEVYHMCWEPVAVATRHINRAETVSIVVAEISPNTVEANPIELSVFEGGLALFRFTDKGKERIGATTSKWIERHFLNEMYPTMFEYIPEDKCIIEVTLSASVVSQR